MKDKDTLILEEIYTNLQNHSDITRLIKEDLDLINENIIWKAITDLGEVLKSSSILSYIGEWTKYIRTLSIIGLSVAAASQLLGWILVGISKIIDKNVEAKKQAREELYRIAYSKELDKLSDEEDLSADEMYDVYINIKDKLARELDKKYPIKGKERWAFVIDKVGNILKDKIGTVALALSGVVLYGKIFGGAPVFPVNSNGAYVDAELGAGNTKIYSDISNFKRPNIPHFGGTSNSRLNDPNLNSVY